MGWIGKGIGAVCLKCIKDHVMWEWLCRYSYTAVFFIFFNSNMSD